MNFIFITVFQEENGDLISLLRMRRASALGTFTKRHIHFSPPLLDPIQNQP